MTKPSDKTAVLFPGQGSQYLGMAAEFLQQSADARALMAQAETICGFPLQRLCQDGPMAELTTVAVLQPAITVVNMICWQELKKAGFAADILAGHSLGEYAALYAAGVLTAQDTLRLVTERGRLMAREGELHPGSMRAVLGLTIGQVEEVLDAVDGVVVVANHNTLTQVVVSGETAVLDAAAARVADRGGKCIPLKVSVANHSPLVAGAVPDFSRIMAEIPFNPPATPLFFNVTAATEEDPDAIRSIMARQIASRVRWYEIVGKLIDSGIKHFVEVGPKTVLSGLVKKILPPDSDCRVSQVETPAAVISLLS